MVPARPFLCCVTWTSDPLCLSLSFTAHVQGPAGHLSHSRRALRPYLPGVGETLRFQTTVTKQEAQGPRLGCAGWAARDLSRPRCPSRPLSPGRQRPASCPAMCARVCQEQAPVPEHLMPRFPGISEESMHGSSAATRLNPGAGAPVLRGPVPALLTPPRTLASLPTFAGKTPLQLPAPASSPCVARGEPATLSVTVTANNSQSVSSSQARPGPSESLSINKRHLISLTRSGN